MLNKDFSVASIIVGSLLLSCTTPNNKAVHHQGTNLAHKQVHSTPEPARNTRTTVGMRQVPLALAADAEYSAFFARLVAPENDYTEKDRQTLMKIPPSPSAGTIHEAALVVGLLRDVLTPIGTTQRRPVTETMATHPDGQTKQTLSPHTIETKKVESRIIELRCHAAGVDLIGALANNPFLKGRSVHQMAFDALALGGNSPIYTENLNSALQHEIASWGQLANQLSGKGNLKGEAQHTSASNEELGVPGSNVITLKNQDNPPQAASSTEGLTSDSAILLAKAQELAAKDKIEQAITTAKLVPENSETYSVAKQNIKTWSDRATQDLRKQAANQYRASSATPDAIGKKIYLSKARTLLEEALSKYPDSSNLETIKENLEIINQELNHLE